MNKLGGLFGRTDWLSRKPGGDRTPIEDNHPISQHSTPVDFVVGAGFPLEAWFGKPDFTYWLPQLGTHFAVCSWFGCPHSTVCRWSTYFQHRLSPSGHTVVQSSRSQVVGSHPRRAELQKRPRTVPDWQVIWRGAPSILSCWTTKRSSSSSWRRTRAAWKWSAVCCR